MMPASRIVRGVIVLTGYLGGATAIQLRAASPPFEVVFPALCSLLVWGGLLLARPGLTSVLTGATAPRATR